MHAKDVNMTFISIRSHWNCFYKFINHLKYHIPIKYLIGVFVPFIILHMEVFLLTMALVLQLLILHLELKKIGLQIFGDHILQ